MRRIVPTAGRIGELRTGGRRRRSGSGLAFAASSSGRAIASKTVSNERSKTCDVVPAKALSVFELSVAATALLENVVQCHVPKDSMKKRASCLAHLARFSSRKRRQCE